MYDYIRALAYFPRYWLLVRGIHRLPVDSPHKGLVTRSFDVFFDVCLTKRWNAQWSCWWFRGSCRSWDVNSSTPCATYTRRWTWSALVQIMACCLDSAKLLSEPVQTYCQLDPKEHASMKFYLKFKYFHSRKCVWTCRLRNGSHFVQGEMS